MTPRKEAIATGALGLVLVLVHAAFHLQDRVPPIWDEALHLLLAARFHDFLASPSRETFDDLFSAWDFYPPLYHASVGALFLVLGVSERAAVVVNLGLLAVLGWGTHRAATALFGKGTGALAAAFVVTSPIVTRMARMAMTDLGVAAFTSAAVGYLMATGLRTRRNAVMLGLLLGAGLLTKWIFPAFVAGPVLAWMWSHMRRPAEGDGWRSRLILAMAVAALVALPWYAANARTILQRGRFLAGLGPAQHNPHGWNWDNASAYARVVLGEFVTAPQRLALLGAGVAALACATGRWAPPHGEAAAGGARWETRRALAVLACWLIVPYVTMSAISNKDPRFVLPLAVPVAVLCAWAVLSIPHRPLRLAAQALVLAYAASLYLVAAWPAPPRALFGVPLLGSALRADLEALSPPADSGWPSAEIVDALRRGLTRVSPSASLEVVPDFVTVNPNTLTWLARRAGFRLVAHHPRDPAEVDAQSWEYVLVKPEGDQGAAHTTGASGRITARVREQADTFVALQEFASASESPLRLLRSTFGVPPADLRAGLVELASPGARWNLGRGWGVAEPQGRWAMGRGAVFRVEMDAGRPHVLEADLVPFPRLSQPQSVTVIYRGQGLATWRLPPAGGVFAADIPAHAPSPEIDEIRFRFAEHARPRDVGLGADERPLAAFFRRIRVVPR